MKTVLVEINAINTDGIVDRYTIGCAVGANFYLEPVATLGVDIFISFQAQSGSLLISTGPVFNDLSGRGARIEGEHLIIGDWPGRFLPTGPVVEEALEEAVEGEVEEIRTRVFTAEHLAAIALQTGRTKYKARLLQFIESGTLSSEQFENILERHALAGSWRQFK